jgi:hypothetical protein
MFVGRGLLLVYVLEVACRLLRTVLVDLNCIESYGSSQFASFMRNNVTLCTA